MNFFYDDIVHAEASAYARWTDFLISTTIIYARPNLCKWSIIYAHAHQTELSVCFAQIIAK